VIVFLLLAAVLLLVGVSMISSIDSSGTRRHWFVSAVWSHALPSIFPFDRLFRHSLSWRI